MPIAFHVCSLIGIQYNNTRTIITKIPKMEEKYPGSMWRATRSNRNYKNRDSYRILCSIGDAAKTEFIIFHSEREF